MRLRGSRASSVQTNWLLEHLVLWVVESHVRQWPTLSISPCQVILANSIGTPYCPRGFAVAVLSVSTRSLSP